MTLTLHAQPYDISAEGFYFCDVDQYDTQVAQVTNAFGGLVEEFEIQFIDGERIDCELAKAFDLSQANFHRFFELVEELDDHEKIAVIIAACECGYDVQSAAEQMDRLDLDIHEVESFTALARDFVDEGLYGDIPEPLQHYIDYEAIGRDLAIDYGAAVIDGRHFIYRCG